MIQLCSCNKNTYLLNQEKTSGVEGIKGLKKKSIAYFFLLHFKLHYTGIELTRCVCFCKGNYCSREHCMWVTELLEITVTF